MHPVSTPGSLLQTSDTVLTMFASLDAEPDGVWNPDRLHECAVLNVHSHDCWGEDISVLFTLGSGEFMFVRCGEFSYRIVDIVDPTPFCIIATIASTDKWVLSCAPAAQIQSERSSLLTMVVLPS